MVLSVVHPCLWRVGVVVGVPFGMLGETRTRDPLIRSWFAPVWIRSNVSGNLAYLRRSRHFNAPLFFPLFSSVLVRLQYGCSTSSLCEGGVVE